MNEDYVRRPWPILRYYSYGGTEKKHVSSFEFGICELNLQNRTADFRSQANWQMTTLQHKQLLWFPFLKYATTWCNYTFTGPSEKIKTLNSLWYWNWYNTVLDPACENMCTLTAISRNERYYKVFLWFQEISFFLETGTTPWRRTGLWR
jgi:hypothetical protein